jgi:hypothetical protein
VDPGSPNTSFLYVKINGGPNLTGSRMPYGLPPISDSLIDSVRVWIENGAQPDETD